MLMRCVHCGMVNPDTVIFCQNCGWRVAGTQSAMGSSSFPPHIPPADSLPPMRSSRLDTSLPAASASQTLLTYCDALQRGEYHQAYEQWTSSVRQQLSEADFAYYYQSRRKVTTCRVSNVSVDNSSAMGTVSLTFADGSAVTAVVLLVMEQGTWKIQGQNSLSEPSGLQATRLCPSNTFISCR